MAEHEPAGAARRGVAALSILAMVVALAPSGAAAAGPAAAAQVLVAVQYRAGYAPRGADLAPLAGSARGPVRAGGHGIYEAALPSGSAASVVAHLRSQPGVEYAEVAQPVHSVATTTNPDDPCYVTLCPVNQQDSSATTTAQQQYLQIIGAPAAWSISKGDGITVAVIDTGADPTNPDLVGPEVNGSYPDSKIVRQTNICATDSLCNDNYPYYDDNGHGSHVTGILAAITDNGTGVAGLGWNVKADEYKVLDKNGDGYTSDVATAIYDAVAAHDQVINLSLSNYSCAQSPGDCGPDPIEQQAVEYAIAHNVVVVAAAGNGINFGDNGTTYPAGYPGVLSVAATYDDGSVAPFSQWGQDANIAAPGVNVVSTWSTVATATPPAQYELSTGTSMSAPQVAAAAALIMSHRPTLSAQQVTELLEANSTATSGGNPINGGVLDVPAALEADSKPPSSYLGYEMAGSDGTVYSFGSVGAFGGLTGHHLAAPISALAMRPDGEGYWLAGTDGGVFNFGQARFLGSLGGRKLAAPIVGMATTADGDGFWLVGADGGVFNFGDAGFYGSLGNVKLAAPIVGIAATSDGKGFWLVGADGGVFNFGDAGFHGSVGGVHLDAKVVGLAPSPDGGGYWLVGADGGVFSEGDAPFYGSAAGYHLQKPAVGIDTTPGGHGYWVLAADGGAFNFGHARFYGSAATSPLPAPVVAAAS